MTYNIEDLEHYLLEPISGPIALPSPGEITRTELAAAGVTVAGSENAYRVTFYDEREDLTLCPFCLCEIYLAGSHNVEQIPTAEISGKCSECAFTLGAPTYVAPSLAAGILAEIEEGLRSGVEL